MNLVWPITALFGSALALWFYFAYGRLATQHQVQAAKRRHKLQPAEQDTPFPIMVAKGALHCGSGCTLGDIVAEWLVFFVPAVAVWFGWQTLFSEKIFAVWILDYIFAFVIGIGFQYFTIKPMRQLSPWQGLVAALQADALSLTAWQVGMYGLMAIAQFYVFRRLLGATPEVNTPEFTLCRSPCWPDLPRAIPSIGGSSQSASRNGCNHAFGLLDGRRDWVVGTRHAKSGKNGIDLRL